MESSENMNNECVEKDIDPTTSSHNDLTNSELNQFNRMQENSERIYTDTEMNDDMQIESEYSGPNIGADPFTDRSDAKFDIIHSHDVPEDQDVVSNQNNDSITDNASNLVAEEVDQAVQFDQCNLTLNNSCNAIIKDAHHDSYNNTVKSPSVSSINNNNPISNSEVEDLSQTLIINQTVTQSETEKDVIKKIYTDPKNSFTVHLRMILGIQIEYYLVPQRFFTTDIEVLLLKDLGLRHASFTLRKGGKHINPLTTLESIADEDRVVRLELEPLNLEDIDKFCLGHREITFRSGLTIKAMNKKIFVSDDPITQYNILKVDIECENAQTSKLIEIDWLTPKHHKPFLGGYRNKETSIIYHNASAQTIPLPRKQQTVVHFSRDTQTYRMKHFGQDTVKQNSTQFTQPGFYVANYQDRVVTPGPYESADDYLARVLAKIIIIQKYVRRWLAKKRVDRLRKIRDEYFEWEKSQAEEYKKERAKRQERDLKRRLNPKTTADFDRLFNALEQWRREEIAKIDAQTLTPAERKVALALLLDEETELIAAIGRHQQCASIKGRERMQHNLLKKAAAPHRWTSAVDKRMLDVSTAETLRGKELLDIFESLSMRYLTRDERLDILLTLKRTVSDDKSKLSKEIVDLIDREAELIIRGIPDRYLAGLRQRIVNRFVQYAKLPEVNPEIAQYLPVPTGKKETAIPYLKGDIFYCLSCDRYLKSSAFPLSARSNRLAPCESCRRQDNRARTRYDLQPYMRILLELRQTEIQIVGKAMEKAVEEAREREIARLEQGLLPEPESIIKTDGTDSSILNVNPFPFLINKEDVKFLIDEVWERRSILSGWLDIDDLVLTRWRQNEPWSPWNTILVTREEADAHAKLGRLKLEEAYADAMLSVVRQRLLMGQNAFHKLFKNGVRMSHEELSRAIRLQNPENTSEWLKERRQMLPPLAKVKTMQTADERHKPTYQPPEQLLPAIKGEKRWSYVIREEVQ